MQIFFDQFPLSRGDDESPTDLSLNGERQVQSVACLRAATATVYPRGNRAHTVTFTVTREHSSHAAAEGFLFFHAATLPANGTVTFLCEDADGGAVRYTAAAAAVAADHGTQLGITTTHRYTLRCGTIHGGELPPG